MRRRTRKGRKTGPSIKQSTEDMSGYFFIKSGLNGLVLDVRGASSKCGTPVVTWNEKPHGNNDSQLFYDDQATGTIRSKASHFCLDMQGDKLVVNPYYQGNQSQQWVWDGTYIHNRYNRDQVLDIMGNNARRGVSVCSHKRNGQANQSWSKYQPLDGYFFIKSSLNGLVLDVPGGSKTPGTPVLTWGQKSYNFDSQLFMEDSASGTIRCKATQYCLDIQGDRLVMNPYYPGNQSQQWGFEGAYIHNRSNRNQVLDIAGNNMSQGAGVCSFTRTGQANQMWSKCMVVPTSPVSPAVSAYPTLSTYPTPSTYPSAPAYTAYPDPPAYTPTVYPGVVPERYFYVKSQLNGLVLDAEGGGTSPGTRLIMWHKKHGDGASNQLFYEDQMSGTIKCKANNLCIQGQGTGMVLHVCRPGDLTQQWMLDGDRVVMRTNPNTVLDILNKNRLPGATVGGWPDNGGNNQKWTIEYI